MGDESSDAVEDMMEHLDDAKDLDEGAAERARKKRIGQDSKSVMRRRSDAAVLGSNYPERLQELERNENVTHRSSDAWTSAEVGVEAHGRLPIYYRQDGMITHKGYITDIIIDPSEDSDRIDKFVENISEDDTYDEYNEMLDTTMYIVTDGRRVEEPFQQSVLQRLFGEGTVDEDYSYQPAYVVQRPGDFPDFP